MRFATGQDTARLPTKRHAAVTVKEITLDGAHISYIHRQNRARRTRSISVTIYPGGNIIVSSHPDYPEHRIHAFLNRKSAWILKKLEQQKKLAGLPTIKRSRGDYKKYKQDALNLAIARLAHFNQHYGFTYKRVSIKNQKTRWGSCSRDGNLNFSYLLSLLSPELADYIIVHELCHLKEFNHSKNFWDLVAETVPNHKELRKELKHGLLTM
jgi:predicted metal-dependent hydrolase